MKHAILKKETSALHDLTETRLGASDIFSENYSQSAYLSHLITLHKVHSKFEKAFLSVAASKRLSDIINIQDFRSKDLEADILGIDSNFNRNEKGTLQFENEHEWVGGFYVLRGSALGNKVIAPKVAEHVAGWALPPQKFYSVGTDSYAHTWPEFKRLLEVWLASDYEAVKLGAEKVYEAFLV